MGLADYHRKRRFERTPEPRGAEPAPASGASGRFVVQRHRARRRHYDVRFEAGGVLVSWAVPKGPSLDPAVKRMAVHVEDHPVEYADFEGVIPSGEYGAGDVVVWDRGTYRLHGQGDFAAALADGELHLEVEGDKLRGHFMLVRTDRRQQGRDWLMFHQRDGHAVPGWDPEDHPRSVLSGRTNDEVAAAGDAVWSPAVVGPGGSAGPIEPVVMPGFVAPMLAATADRAFSHPEWRFELKWDGHRVQAHVRDGEVRLFSRRGLRIEDRFPELAGPPTWIAARQAIVDGEVVALDADGRPSFSLLQARLGRGGAERPAAVVLQAFDLLHLDGRSLLDRALSERSQLLHDALRPHPLVRPTQFVNGDGEAYFANVRAAGLEGIVAKRRASTYRPGVRSRDWLKVKARREQELLVCGWQPYAGDANRVGSLQLAVHDGDRLVHAGGVGAGFDDAERRRLVERLRPLEVAEPMVEGVPSSASRSGAVRWVRPELVVRCELAEWTRDAKVRHASYRGIDDDAVPAMVTRERSVAAPPIDDRPSPTPDELAALDVLGAEGDWEIGGRVVRLTNLDKVLFPGGDGEPPATKRDLVRYYASMAPVMLAHLRDRPLNLHRFPNGVGAAGFWHKQVPGHLPDWVTTWRHDEARPGRTTTYIVADHVATLAWLANYGAVELHPWTSRVPGVTHPTAALIDIDPGERTSWAEVVVLARLHWTALDHVGLVGVPKVTGQRGLQIWVPIEPGLTYDDTRDWVEALSRAVAAVVPELVSWEWEKRRRQGRARLDFTQNAFSKTLVAPYSVRATARATVSMPIVWDELDDADLRPDRWTIRSAPARVAERGDLFAPTLTVHQVLPVLSSVTPPHPG